MPRLKRADCSDPGIRRVRRGRGFSYVDDITGERIDDPETIERITDLVIPPAWKDVWICPFPNGHIQATGFDEAGRKQYLYHDRWREHRDREKFEKVLELAEELPRVRRRLKRDLKRRGLVRERVLACSIRLLDLGFFRIGSEQYAEENETYGLATLRKRHVSFERGLIVFSYEAKGAQQRVQTIDDAEIIPIIRALKRRQGGGHELLAYRENGGWRDVRSDQINEYLKEVAGKRVHRQGLPHLERDGPRRGRARPGGGRRDLEDRPQACRDPGGEGGVRVPGQHARRLPRLLHRPPRLRLLRLRYDDPPPPGRARRQVRPEAPDPPRAGRARGARADRLET